jgi:hypothetical protein
LFRCDPEPAFLAPRTPVLSERKRPRARLAGFVKGLTLVSGYALTAPKKAKHLILGGGFGQMLQFDCGFNRKGHVPPHIPTLVSSNSPAHGKTLRPAQ